MSRILLWYRFGCLIHILIALLPKLRIEKWTTLERLPPGQQPSNVCCSWYASPYIANALRTPIYNTTHVCKRYTLYTHRYGWPKVAMRAALKTVGCFSVYPWRHGTTRHCTCEFIFCYLKSAIRKPLKCRAGDTVWFLMLIELYSWLSISTYFLSIEWRNSST